MSETVISVNELGKRYRIGVKLEKDKNIREGILNAFKAPFRNFRRLRKLTDFKCDNGEAADDIIWALKDVSFEVNKGEVVGIIGKNGSGKSTLLKILSRITEPTTGCAKIKGRISSLLEVGTGFHKELTGRENIYLNGSILGMRKWEIDKKFDEIVAFSEIEKFIDTPVKRYSSGMYVRLAFAVAAHLEPEILLVDEVLAVGDVAFQKKCLGKMRDVARGGRTVLFVSHNMGAIRELCSTAIWLRSGQVTDHGLVASVLECYMRYMQSSSGGISRSVVKIDKQPTDKKLMFSQISFISSPDAEGMNNSVLKCCLIYQILKDSIGAVIAIRINSIYGAPIMTLTDIDLNENRFIRKKGKYKVICPIPIHFLAPGIYHLTVSAADMKGTRYDYHENILSFEVSQSAKIKPTFSREGSLLVPIKWDLQEENDDSR